MSDEQTKPEEETVAQAEEVAEETVEEVSAEVQDQAEEAVEQAEEVVEDAAAVQEDSPAPVAAAEPVAAVVAEDHHHDDMVMFMGSKMPVYTAVFVVLAVLTITEVILSEIIPGDAKIPFLVAIASAKATLVVMYYMHLRTDSKVYTVVLAVPVVLAILSILFLLGVPTGGY